MRVRLQFNNPQSTRDCLTSNDILWLGSFSPDNVAKWFRFKRDSNCRRSTIWSRRNYRPQHRLDRSSQHAWTFDKPNVDLARQGDRFALRNTSEDAKPASATVLDVTRRTLAPTLRPRLAANPAVPDIGKSSQKHRAGQHRREQKCPRQIA